MRRQRHKKLPPQDVLLDLLRYNRATGALTWKKRPLSWFPDERAYKIWNTRYAEKPAFTARSQGFFGAINGTTYQAHRVIWKIVTGHDPLIIDHIDGDSFNNAFSNLRNVTHTLNSRNQKLHSNNTSGHAGVYWSKKESKWVSYITFNGKKKRLGSFADKSAAVKVREDAEQKYRYTGRSSGGTA